MLSPGAAVEDVDAGAADQHVVAVAAEQHVVAVAADQDVVAVAAVGGELDRAGRQARGLDHVVAGQGVDRQPVVGGLGAGDVDLGGQAEDATTPLASPTTRTTSSPLVPLTMTLSGCAVAAAAARPRG